MEPHDLWISKAIAGRTKDLEFCQALIDRNLVQVGTLRTRLKQVRGLDRSTRDRVLKLIVEMK